MTKRFNTTGACSPVKHYMVDLTSRLEAIKAMVENGDYFTISRARQYGKTTTLRALASFLRDDYEVVSLDFQRLDSEAYSNTPSFVAAFSAAILRTCKNFPHGIQERLLSFSEEPEKNVSMQRLFQVLEDWCAASDRPVVMLIDEVDTATNNQIFMDFLAQLRAAYLDRDITPAFQSVILAGVYDVRNIKRKIRPDEEQKVSSPWNIAAKFTIDMNFSADEISGMIDRYEADYSTGMSVKQIADLIYDYTSGYPVLVSGLCKMMDEDLVSMGLFPDRKAVWTLEGVKAAVNILISEQNDLFDSLFDKLEQYPEMKEKIYMILFRGQPIPYNPDDPATKLLQMFGFVRNDNGFMQIANRIFETRIYNCFLMTTESTNTEIFRLGVQEKNQFVKNGLLDMDKLLRKFIEYFDDIYGDQSLKFAEDDGRRYFMLFLKPVINGTGNYYVEARTRNLKQTDLIIDYLGNQYIVELKLWRGNAYNERGEKQLAEYLDYYHLKKGYMLSFCFNKNKKIGLKEVKIGDRLIVEAVV
ncbi:MAG: AAA-like domain-containing protein [Clostridiales bacterium]|nr:AAA-like domain-containing protein [Clostridiales bacterium]